MAMKQEGTQFLGLTGLVELFTTTGSPASQCQIQQARISGTTAPLESDKEGGFGLVV